jgi:hypothetical protein
MKFAIRIRKDLVALVRRSWQQQTGSVSLQPLQSFFDAVGEVYVDATISRDRFAELFVVKQGWSGHVAETG